MARHNRSRQTRLRKYSRERAYSFVAFCATMTVQPFNRLNASLIGRVTAARPESYSWTSARDAPARAIKQLRRSRPHVRPLPRSQSSRRRRQRSETRPLPDTCTRPPAPRLTTALLSATSPSSRLSWRDHGVVCSAVAPIMPCVALRKRARRRLRRAAGANAIVRPAPGHGDRRDSDVAKGRISPGPGRRRKQSRGRSSGGAGGRLGRWAT